MEFKNEDKFGKDEFSETTLSFFKHAVEIFETEMTALLLLPTPSSCMIILLDEIIQLLRKWINQAVNVPTVTEGSQGGSSTYIFSIGEMYKWMGIILWIHTLGFLLHKCCSILETDKRRIFTDRMRTIGYYLLTYS